MKYTVLQTDITSLQVDAIVNAANSSLLGGSGVDGAIHRKAGPLLLEACKAVRAKQGSCKTGEAVITIAGNLQTNYVIHTVGPVWNEGSLDKEALLANCYKNSLQLAADYGLKRIAFPCISTGIYKFPKDLAAQIAVRTVKAFEASTRFDEIIFACYDIENYKEYQHLLNEN